jgi:hypothetical protein
VYSTDSSLGGKMVPAREAVHVILPKQFISESLHVRRLGRDLSEVNTSQDMNKWRYPTAFLTGALLGSLILYQTILL